MLYYHHHHHHPHHCDEASFPAARGSLNASPLAAQTTKATTTTTRPSGPAGHVTRPSLLRVCVRVQMLSVWCFPAAPECGKGVSCLLLAPPPLDGEENMPKKTKWSCFFFCFFYLYRRPPPLDALHRFSSFFFSVGQHLIEHCLVRRLYRSEKFCLASLPAGSRRTPVQPSNSAQAVDQSAVSITSHDPV